MMKGIEKIKNKKRGDIKRSGYRSTEKPRYQKKFVNPSTPRPEGQGLLRVDPEPRLLTPSLKMGLGAVERVKFQT